MVQLQWLTGMRPGEVTILRTIDLDMTGKVWVYRPGSDQGAHGQHKTAHRGQSRIILIGPKAQEVLRPWLRLGLTEYLFQPCEAREQFDARTAGFSNVAKMRTFLMSPNKKWKKALTEKRDPNTLKASLIITDNQSKTEKQSGNSGVAHEDDKPCACLVVKQESGVGDVLGGIAGVRAWY